jgi:hypothetical protein
MQEDPLKNSGFDLKYSTKILNAVVYRAKRIKWISGPL